jgi:sodium transport system ATP-binding protein
LIQTQGLTKTFQDGKRGDVTAVDDLTFHCPGGKVYGLLGRNGAGKTTTLRMLATILLPTRGSATIHGFDIVREGARVRERIGFHTGDTKLYDRLSGRESLIFYGRLHGLSPDEARERAAKVAATYGLADFLDRRVGKMSTGQQQRVSLARVALHDPPVLILDEPTAGLDVIGARDVLEAVRRFRDAGKSILFSTHIMAEAEKLCDIIGIIEGGRLLAEGAPDELKSRAGSDDLEDVFVRLIEPARTAAADAAAGPRRR